MPKQRKQHWPDGWKQQKTPKQLSEKDIQDLKKWMRSVSEWGAHLRDDLIRLEGNLGLAVGDPGDPPPPPWLDDDD